jgi:hypothetical protein
MDALAEGGRTDNATGCRGAEDGVGPRSVIREAVLVLPKQAGQPPDGKTLPGAPDADDGPTRVTVSWGKPK